MDKEVKEESEILAEKLAEEAKKEGWSEFFYSNPVFKQLYKEMFERIGKDGNENNN